MRAFYVILALLVIFALVATLLSTSVCVGR